jgi:hypothetical protein
VAQTVSNWQKWLGPVLVPAIGTIWYLAYPYLHSPVSRLLDSFIVAGFSAAVFAAVSFTPRLANFRQNLGLALALILGYALLFYYAKAIAWHHLTFAFILLLSLGPRSPGPQPKLSLRESFRYVRRMLRNQPSEKEAELLAAIRLNRKSDKI